MKKTVIQIIRLYKLCISPFLPDTCRFHPSCSQYMIESIQKNGAVKGIFNGLKRIFKCHPFNPGGYDPVK